MALLRSSFGKGPVNSNFYSCILKHYSNSRNFSSGIVFFKHRHDRKQPLDVTLKSSRPLKENVLGENAKKPNKPGRYVVFGDISVDERTFTKMQEENSDNEDMEEEDLQNVLQNSDKLYHLYKEEAKEHRKFIRTKTLERKMFPRHIEPCLLTWAARDQMKYLHGLDPDKWTADELANHFPVSIAGAVKLLKSSFKHATEKRIQNYDESVMRNWGRIRKGEIDNLDPSLQERFFKKQLKPSQALPNTALPLPPPRNPNPSPFLLDDPNKPVGEFYALVKPYVELVRKAEDLKAQNVLPNATGSCVSSTVALQNIGKMNNQFDLVGSHECPTLDDELGETDERKYRKSMRRKVHFTHEQFEENLKDALKNKERKSDEADQMLSWLESQRFLESKESISSSSYSQDDNVDQQRKVYKKYKEQPKVNYESAESEYVQAYMYSESTGYQHPFGKSDSMDRITIDESLKKEGDLYKVGDSFYSEDGEFIFKVFTK